MGGVMSSIVVSGDTSGAITLAAPAVAGSNTLTLPASTGTLALSSSVPASTTVCKAWVSFNGSANTIYSSYNISSITKNGTGQYVANITNALANTNYAVVASCSVVGSYPLFCNIHSTSPWSVQAPTTTAVETRIEIWRGGSARISNLTTYNSAGALASQQTVLVYDSPATTSATTYTIYMAAGGTGYINPNGGTDGAYSLTLQEIAA